MLPDVYRRVVNAKYILERAATIQRENHEMSVAVSLPLDPLRWHFHHRRSVRAADRPEMQVALRHTSNFGVAIIIVSDTTYLGVTAAALKAASTPLAAIHKY